MKSARGEPVARTGLEGQKRAQPGKKWANFLHEHFREFPLLAANGFRPEGEALFHPVRIDAAALADAYPDKSLYLQKSDNTMQAAGGLVSTAPDLARFLIAQLQQGKFAIHTFVRLLNRGNVGVFVAGELVGVKYPGLFGSVIHFGQKYR